MFNSIGKIFRGYMGDTDIETAEDCGIYNSKTIKWLKETKDSDEPNVCLIHRRVQEDLAELGFEKDKEIWKKNCEVIHTCDVDEAVKKHSSYHNYYDYYDYDDDNDANDTTNDYRSYYNYNDNIRPSSGFNRSYGGGYYDDYNTHDTDDVHHDNYSYDIADYCHNDYTTSTTHIERCSSVHHETHNETYDEDHNDGYDSDYNRSNTINHSVSHSYYSYQDDDDSYHTSSHTAVYSGGYSSGYHDEDYHTSSHTTVYSGGYSNDYDDECHDNYNPYEHEYGIF